MMYQTNQNLMQNRMMHPATGQYQIQYNNNYLNNNNENNVNKKETFTIDKIREFPLKMIMIEREYDIVKEIGK